MKMKLLNFLIFFLSILLFSSNSFSLTKKSLLKESKIDDTKLSCLYFADGTKLGQVKRDGAYRYINIDNKINTAKKKRDNFKKKYRSESDPILKSGYNTKFKKFKKQFKQLSQCKKYNPAELACEIYESQGTNYKVINGAKCKNQAKSVVGKVLVDRINNTEAICSATLIGPNVFLAAAHCFASEVAISKALVLFQGKSYNVSSWYVNPNYNNIDEYADTSLIYISKNLNVEPMKLVSKNYEAKASELAAIIGHGIASFQPYVTGFYGGFVTLDAVTSSGIAAIYNSKFGDSNTCNGDSGGPLAVYENGSWRLFGVTSFGDDDYCGYFTGAENSWWSKINSPENIDFIESHLATAYDK